MAVEKPHVKEQAYKKVDPKRQLDPHQPELEWQGIIVSRSRATEFSAGADSFFRAQLCPHYRHLLGLTIWLLLAVGSRLVIAARFIFVIIGTHRIDKLLDGTLHYISCNLFGVLDRTVPYRFDAFACDFLRSLNDLWEKIHAFVTLRRFFSTYLTRPARPASGSRGLGSGLARA